MSKTAAKKNPKETTRDPVLRALEAASETIRTLTPKEAFELAIRAGIYTTDGKLAAPYRSPPSKKA